VTDAEVVVGMNAVFTGPSAGLGIEMWRGATAAFEEANAAGGVHGRRIRLVLSDDGYEAERAAPAIIRLIEQDNVFNSGWSVGTPTIVRALPVILQYHQTEDFFHFGNFTGAQPQRNPPYSPAVFNLRASYRQETKAMVDAFVQSGKRRIGTFVQDDAYGTDGREGVIAALRAHGLELVADTRYRRGQTFEEDYTAQMDILKRANADAIVMVGSYQACGGFIRDARKAGWDVPIHNVSFVGADQMLDFLRRERGNVPNILSNLLVTQVVPHPDATSLAGVTAFRAAIDRHNPQKPAEFPSGEYTVSNRYSFGALEGYLTGVLYLRVLDAVGRDLTRRRFIETAERGIGPPPAPAEGGGAAPTEGEGEAAPPTDAPRTDSIIDLGIGVPATFSADDHQALDSVWFTHATPEGWRHAEDVSTVLR
jgi:ABC-type branched-subunit amino acid transport system substrate-binding protein